MTVIQIIKYLNSEMHKISLIPLLEESTMHSHHHNTCCDPCAAPSCRLPTSFHLKYIPAKEENNKDVKPRYKVILTQITEILQG